MVHTNSHIHTRTVALYHPKKAWQVHIHTKWHRSHTTRIKLLFTLATCFEFVRKNVCMSICVCVMLYLYLKLLLRANFKTASRQQQRTKLQCSKLNSTKKEATALHVTLYNSLYNPRIIIRIKRKSIKPCNVCEMRSLPSSSLLPPRLLLTQLELCCPNKPLSLSHGMSTHVLHRTMNLVADIFQTQVDFFRKMDRTKLLMDLHAYVRNMRR